MHSDVVSRAFHLNGVISTTFAIFNQQFTTNTTTSCMMEQETTVNPFTGEALLLRLGVSARLKSFGGRSDMHVESIIYVKDYEGWVESIDRSKIQSFQQMRKDQIR